MKKFPLPKLLPVFLLTFIFFTANAQKLPNVQQISLRAPANIKIDGKATEWNNQFQANNHATDIFYTIANDDKNLYLTVQAPDPGIINKILKGGVAFTICKSAKRDYKEAVNITYPVLKGNMLFINFSDIKSAPLMKEDSFAMANNGQLAAKSKIIKVTGIKGVDTLTSIYNRDGIKAVSLFDNKMVYTYELAVDLSLLGLDMAKPEKFAYNIALAGESIRRGSVRDISRNLIANTPGIGARIEENPVDLPTDFWGEYTLAKK